jgi:hypothetical protein
MKRKPHFLFVLILAFYTISWALAQDGTFIFQRGNQKVTLETANGKRHLKWNEKTRLTVKCENIDSKKLALSAPGLSLVKGVDANNESLWEILPKKQFINGDTLKLYVSGSDVNDSAWRHTFKIWIIE